MSSLFNNMFGGVSGGGSGGTTVHNELTGRDAMSCHPISAITQVVTL